PLLYAVATGHIEVVRALLAAHADVKNTAVTMTALHLAAWGGNADLVRVLITSGAYLDTRARDDNTPLMLAAKTGHAGTVNLLVSAGADVNAVNPWGETALSFAAKAGH